MKTMNLFTKLMIVLSAGIVMSSSAIALNPAKVLATNNKKIQQKIAEAMIYPENCMTKWYNGQTAEVTFVLTEEGKIDIKNVNCECKVMEACVRKQLSNVYCSNAIHPYNQLYKIKIRFQYY